ncbi:hypothetical protein JOM56_004464 [Amanita muscaria]
MQTRLQCNGLDRPVRGHFQVRIFMRNYTPRFNLDDVVDALTTDEAILLTAGVGLWHTHSIPRLGIPAIKVMDITTLLLVAFNSCSLIKAASS